MATTPKYVEACTEVDGEDRIRVRYYTHRNELGLVSGMTMTVRFAVAAPAREVWPVLQDPNLWQNEGGYYWSMPLADLEGGTFRLTLDPDDDGPDQYEVWRVIPEHLIVISQPLLEGNDIGGSWQIGLGGVRPGFHVIELQEYDGTSIVDFHMEHGTLAAAGADAETLTEEEAIAVWRELTEWVRPKWRDEFIPKFRAVVAERAG